MIISFVLRRKWLVKYILLLILCNFCCLIFNHRTFYLIQMLCIVIIIKSRIYRLLNFRIFLILILKNFRILRSLLLFLSESESKLLILFLFINKLIIILIRMTYLIILYIVINIIYTPCLPMIIIFWKIFLQITLSRLGIRLWSWMRPATKYFRTLTPNLINFGVWS